jgi:hypothetical protein
MSVNASSAQYQCPHTFFVLCVSNDKNDGMCVSNDKDATVAAQGHVWLRRQGHHHALQRQG